MQLGGYLIEPKKSQGVGFVEVLISLLVLSIGLLGMVSVHSRGLQYNQSSYLQSQATFLVTDMLDRIQANSTVAMTSTQYQTASNEHQFSQCNESNYPSTCEDNSCNPEQMAFYDILQWKFQLACQAPGSQGSITFSDSDDARHYIIRISFPDMNYRVPLNDVVVRGIL